MNDKSARDDAFEQFAEMDLQYSEGPVDSDELVEFVDSQKFPLPEDYSDFMLKFGPGDYPCARIMTLENCVDCKDFYTDSVPELETGEIVPFADDYSGAQYCFDYRAWTAGQTDAIPIVLIENGIEATTAPSFLDFILIDHG